MNMRRISITAVIAISLTMTSTLNWLAKAKTLPQREVVSRQTTHSSHSVTISKETMQSGQVDSQKYVKSSKQMQESPEMQKKLTNLTALLKRNKVKGVDADSLLSLSKIQRKEKFSAFLSERQETIARLDSNWTNRQTSDAVVLADTVYLPSKVHLPGETLIFANNILLEGEECRLLAKGDVYLIANNVIKTQNTNAPTPKIIMDSRDVTTDKKISYAPYKQDQKQLESTRSEKKRSFTGLFKSFINSAAGSLNFLPENRNFLIEGVGGKSWLNNGINLKANASTNTNPELESSSNLGGGTQATGTPGAQGVCGVNSGQGGEGGAGAAGVNGDKGMKGAQGFNGQDGWSLFINNGSDCSGVNIYFYSEGDDGGEGGPGQSGIQGGDGGQGGKGGDGANCACSEYGGPSEGWLNGGKGGKGGKAGKGGDGGDGGNGGNGGNGGSLWLVIDCVCALPYSNIYFHSVGGDGGQGSYSVGSPAPNGSPGPGGEGGAGGTGIGPNCPNGSNGSPGGSGDQADGFASPGQSGNMGSNGFAGNLYIICFY